MDNFVLNQYFIALLTTGIINGSLAIFVILNGFNKRLNQLLALYSLSLSVWSIFEAFGITCQSKTLALLLWRINHIGVIFIPVFLTHFVFNLLDIKGKRRKLIPVSYMVACFFTILDATPLLILEVVPKFSFRYFINPGHLYYVFFWSWIAWAIYGNAELINEYFRTSGHRRIQMKYFCWSLLFSYLGGVPNFFPTFNIEIPILMPYATYAIPLYAIFTTYAIIRHQLIDIKVVIKKALVFGSLFTIVFSIFVGTTLLTQQFIVGGRLVGLALSSIIIIFAVQPLERILVRITNKYLFQKKYDYKHVLKAFIDEVITVLSLDSVIQSTIDLLDKTLHPESIDIMVLNRMEDKYVSFRNTVHNEDIKLESASRIPVLLKSINDIFSVESSGAPIRITGELKNEMKRLNARLAIPLMLHNDLIGIMLLGKKKSDEEYTKDDLDILTDLSRTEAIAIGNAQLFAETAQNERRAAIGTLAAGINHEIGNPLNIINTKMQVFLMSLDRGLYKGRTPEDIINESKDIMNICLQQTTRISEITKKLSSFAKPSKDFRPELTDIEEQLDDTLSVVGHDLELERIEIKKNIQKPLPKILSDKRQVQQIFFNIIKNAGQSIKESGVIEIRAYDKKDGNVSLEISDTGHGIPEDKIDKIYEPFFTTKEPGKGTGLGLAIVRQLVWRNKGDIKVKSKVGEGTTFTITFPAAK